MSVQSLLPKDTVVRSLAITIDNDELSPTYMTKDGPIKERNAHVISEGLMSTDLNTAVEATKVFIKSGSVVSSIDKTVLDANHQVWKLLNVLMSDRVILSNDFKNTILSQDVTAAEAICSARTGNWITNGAKYSINKRYGDVTPTFVRFHSVADYLEDTRDKFNSSAANDNKEWKRNGTPDGFDFKDPFSKNRLIRFYQCGSIVVVRVNKKRIEDGYDKFIMTNNHFARVVDYFKNAATLSLFTPDINGMDSTIGAVLKVIRYQIKIGLVTPNGAGSVFKTARQILFLRGDRSATLGNKPVNLYMGGLSGVKEKYGEVAADFLMDITSDRKSAINLANVFKMVPHPDQDMEEVFNSIEGFKDANPVNDTRMDRFEGMARKAVYESLVQQKFQVRSLAKDPDDDIATSFARSMNSTSTPTSSILSAGYTKWSSVVFQEVRGIFDSESQDIPVSNKSSGTNGKLKQSEIENIPNMKKLSDYKSIKERLRSVNDIASRLAGNDDLNFKQARKRFLELIKIHEDFESTYLAKGITIDDIPSDDLSKFVISSPDNHYMVGTEPKLGEVHKEITRMFYMAQQLLKMMTQVCERFTKKVISKASGISIVKDYRSRRKELEAMLYSYTGIVVGDDNTVLFISFDMAEFSKKFPQKIVRMIGKILSELSGEDWMGRIDLFFRAALVYHNTRGFIGVKAGVTGGFEGFLNFLWTLAMRIVMDIATQSTGVKGVLAVYSDDGLLRLYVEGDKATVTAKILTIQKVFKDYGLIFHMDKTVASPEILEYLGVYGEDGMIIPTWIKEAMSVGKRKRNKGIETVFDRVSLWDSQCTAVTKANGPAYTPFLLKTILTIRTLRRLNVNAPSRALAALTAIPYSAGGFRVSSISESSVLSGITGFVEFTADMELLMEYSSAYTNTILHRISNNLKTESEAEGSIITGSLLQTDLIDTSGMGAIKSLLENADIDGIATSDPITKEIKKRILNQLKKSKNIPVKIVSNLIQTIPDVIEYNKTVAILKSDAALDFVSKKEIKKVQYNDTRKCKKSIAEWVEILKNSDDEISNIRSDVIAGVLLNKMYPSYDISIQTDSPRTCIFPTIKDPHIITTLEFTRTAKLLYQEYKEPEAKFLGAQLSPEASAEYTSSTKQRRYDRFIASAARLIASNNSLLPIYYLIANSFSLPCPALPSSSVISAHRSTKNFGLNAVNVLLPAPFHALILSRMSNKMWNELNSKHRADRTTLVECAKVATYLNAFSSIDDSCYVREGSTAYLYNVRELDRNTSNPTFEMLVIPRHELINNEATKSFTSVLVEESAQSRMLDSTIVTNGIIESVKDTPIVKAILTIKFEKWLSSCTSGISTNNILPPNIPDAWKVEIYVESCVSVAFRICSPSARRVLQTSLATIIHRSKDLSINEIMNSTEAMRDFRNAYASKEWAFDELGKHIKDIYESLTSIDIDNRILEEIGDMNISDSIVTESIIKFIKRKSITGGELLPTVIINTDSFADSKLSREVKNTIKSAVDNMICDFLDVNSSETRWKRQNTNDTIINFLYVLKNMIRPSGHRNSPFNKHMVAIQLIKLEVFIRECINGNITSVDTEDLLNFRLSREITNAVMNNNAVIAGRTSMTSGSDMRDCLMYEGIPTWSIARVNYILRNLSTTYSSNSITNDRIINDRSFMPNMLNYVMETYNSVVRSSVDGIEIRHNREAEKVGNATNLSPVEEARLIAATIDRGDLVAYEEDIHELVKSDMYRDIIANLLLAHYSRWLTNGYTSVPAINDILKRHGMFGGSELEVRDINESPMATVIRESDFTLSISSYFMGDIAIHNYIYINRLEGGMAIMAKDGDSYLIFSIIPKGTRTINTTCMNMPRYVGDNRTEPPIYDIKKSAANLAEIARAIGARPIVLSNRNVEGSVVVQQAYQRMVGQRGCIEDEDVFLVALGEVVRGSWSVELSLRVLAMFSAWVSSTGEVRVRDYKLASNEVYRSAADPNSRVNTLSSAASVWTWVRMSNIVAGPNIDTSKVSRIASMVGKDVTTGGGVAAFYSFAPVKVSEMKSKRGSMSLDYVIKEAPSIVFIAPEVVITRNLIEYVDPDDDEEW